jgi:RND family efflux transporter MFP subunit
MRFFHISFMLTLLISLLGLGCSDAKTKSVPQTETPKTAVDVYTLKKETLPIWIEFSGKTEAYSDVAVLARVKGTLEKIFFKPGDHVKKGDILFKIEESEYRAILNQKEASKKKNQASLKLAISSLERYKPLVEKELATREKLDQLIAQKEEIEALIKADESAIAQAKLNLDYTEVRASIDGTIGKNLIDVGNVVGSSADNSKLADIIQYNPLYANFTPSGKDVTLINRYKSEEYPKVKVYIPSQNKADALMHDGAIDYIDSKTNESTGTVAMRALIQNPNYTLRAGTFVQIKLFLSDQIPLFALSPNNVMENQLGSYLFVVNEKGILEIKQVKVTFSTKEMLIIDYESLKEGDKIVVSPLAKLQKGQAVIVKDVPNPVVK